MTARSPQYDPANLPLLSSDLPGTGGEALETADFRVEEIPAYLPCGEGQHCMALVRKQGLTTPQAIQRICGGLGLRTGAAGFAGMKDRHGITSQWISFDGATPEQLRAIQDSDLEVLEANLHRNKLRTGHLRGNRFTIVLRGAEEGAMARGRAILEMLEQDGMPNYFGAQRFGRKGDNAAQGLAMLRGEGRPPRQRFMKRLLISALQSWLFNEVLAKRLRRGCVNAMIGGEVLQTVPGSGLFVSEDTVADAPRLAAGEVVNTGPILGPRMPWPAESSAARGLEDEVLDECGVLLDDMSAAGRLGRGGRRALIVKPEQPSIQETAEGLQVSFILPPGSYATVLLRELTK